MDQLDNAPNLFCIICCRWQIMWWEHMSWVPKKSIRKQEVRKWRLRMRGSLFTRGRRVARLHRLKRGFWIARAQSADGFYRGRTHLNRVNAHHFDIAQCRTTVSKPSCLIILHNNGHLCPVQTRRALQDRSRKE